VEKTYIECTDFNFLSEETAHEFGQSCEHCHWCFDPWKDILIPGYIEQWSITQMAKHEKP